MRADEQHQWELEQQEREEAERIRDCEKALAELNAIIDEKLQKVIRGLH
jgi:hypothetical protein